MPLSGAQIVTSLVALAAAALACAWRLGRPAARGPRAVLLASAALAVVTWFRFGALHALSVDDGTGHRAERHWPVQFHELFHYDLGAKYFGELGYLGLYDCAVRADDAIAQEDHAAPRVTGTVRNLSDVLTDLPRGEAAARCEATWRPRFTAARWRAFVDDVRALARFVPDDAWDDVVFDAGFNPPPSTVLLYGAAASALPLRVSPPWWALLTSIDLALMALAVAAIGRAWGVEAAAVATVALGTGFLSNYGWLGGALLRMLWIAALAGGLAALSRRRWGLAGALLGVAACDRIFPAAFLAGAALPLAVRAAREAEGRAALARLMAGSLAAALALCAAGTLAFGADVWAVFAARTLRYDDVYFVLHHGLKKLLTFRGWVPDQDFHGHEGLARFRDWNLRLQGTWVAVRPLGVAVQLAALAATVRAAVRRAPEEAAMLAGAVAMYLFTMPASYYEIVLALAPALLLRDAARTGRVRSALALGAFGAFWALCVVSLRVWHDDIVASFAMDVGLAATLAVWVGAWWTPALQQVEERREGALVARR